MSCAESFGWPRRSDAETQWHSEIRQVNHLFGLGAAEVFNYSITRLPNSLCLCDSAVSGFSNVLGSLPPSFGCLSNSSAPGGREPTGLSNQPCRGHPSRT